MIRKFGIILITLTILSAGTALGALEELEKVAELPVSGVLLPSSSAGQVVYRECSGCEPTIWPVNAATQYYVGVNTKPVPLADLRQAVASKQYDLIYVFRTPDSGTVTRIILDLTQATDK